MLTAKSGFILERQRTPQGMEIFSTFSGTQRFFNL
jgi:hypothetical protein